jgi:hypothetical protein
MRTFQCDLRFVDCIRFAPDGRSLQAFGTRRSRKHYGGILAGRMLEFSDPSADFRACYDYARGDLVAQSDDGLWRAVAFRGIDVANVVIIRPGEDSRRQPRRQPPNIEDAVCLAFVPFGPLLGIGFANSVRRGHKAHIQHGVCIWNIEKRREHWRFATKARPGEVVFSPDARHVAVSHARGSAVWLFDHAARTAIGELACRNHQRLAFSGRGNFLAAAGTSLIVWSAGDWKRHLLLRGQDEDLPGLAFSPDEHLLTVARSDGPVEFYDVPTGRLLRSYNWNIGRLSAVAFAPDGLTCAVAGAEGRIVVWDVDDR